MRARLLRRQPSDGEGLRCALGLHRLRRRVRVEEHLHVRVQGGLRAEQQGDAVRGHRRPHARADGRADTRAHRVADTVTIAAAVAAADAHAYALPDNAAVSV